MGFLPYTTQQGKTVEDGFGFRIPRKETEAPDLQQKGRRPKPTPCIVQKKSPALRRAFPTYAFHHGVARIKF
jgi:hypothetical protein